MSNKQIKKFKILLLGDSSVGKTSLLVRYTDNIYNAEEISTLGIDYRVKCISINNENIHLDLWDTAGQERFKSIAKNYFKGAHGFLFVYDITRKESFDGMKNWIREAERNSGHFQYVIVGNKCDLEDKRQVPFEDLKRLGENYNAPYFEASAKMEINVNECFSVLANNINDAFQPPETQPTSSKLTKKKSSKKKDDKNCNC